MGGRWPCIGNRGCGGWGMRGGPGWPGRGGPFHPWGGGGCGCQFGGGRGPNPGDGLYIGCIAVYIGCGAIPIAFDPINPPPTKGNNGGTSTLATFDGFSSLITQTLQASPGSSQEDCMTAIRLRIKLASAKMWYFRTCCRQILVVKH